MSYNHIIKKKTLGSVISGGKRLVLSAATETDHWTRPDFMADKLKAPLEKAVESSPEEIPSWADEVCARESNHECEKDPVTHITAVVSDKSATKAQSIHLPLPKK